MITLQEYIAPYMSTIPHRNEMLVENIDELKKQSLDKFLKEMDDKEKIILETNAEKKTDYFKSRNAKTIVTGIAGGIITFLFYRLLDSAKLIPNCIVSIVTA